MRAEKGLVSPGCPKSQGTILASLLLLLVTTAIIYVRVANFPAIIPGDDTLYERNDHVRAGLAAESIRWALIAHGFGVGYPSPLTFLSHELDFELFGNDAGLHHVTNLAIHLANVLILFCLLSWATGRAGRALVVAALFALHPLAVESTVWIAERKNLLSTFFFLLALGAYGFYAKGPSVKRYFAVAALFALGLASKPAVIILPCVLLLLDFWPLRRIHGWTPVPSPVWIKGKRVIPKPPFTQRTPVQLIVEKLWLMPLCIASAAITIFGQSGILADSTKVPLPARTTNAIYSLLLYLRDLFFPLFLARDYPFSLGYFVTAAALAKVGLALSLLVTVTVVAWRARVARPYLLVGWSWFLGTLAPVSGILWMGDYSRADRYTYLAGVGIFVAVVWGLADWMEQRAEWISHAIAVAILAALSFLTWRQVGFWQSGATLWTHAIEVEGETPENRLALAYASASEQQSDTSTAHELTDAQSTWTEELLKRAPQDAQANFTHGEALLGAGHSAEAIAAFRTALKLTSDSFFQGLIFSELASAFYLTGDSTSARTNFGEMRTHFHDAVRMDPRRLAELAKQFTGYVEANPAASRFVTLTVLLQESGDDVGADKALAEAKRLSPGFDFGLVSPSLAQSLKR